MSNRPLLDPETTLKTTVRTPVKTARRAPRPIPARAPSVRRRPSRRILERTRSAARPRTMALVETLFHAVLAFGGAALATMCVVSLAGNVLLESSRRSTIEMTSRLKSEDAARSELRGKVEALASTEAVEDWAHEHGLLASEETPAPPKVVPPTNVKAERTLVARR